MTDRSEMVKERNELQEQFREYVKANGFDYQEYLLPPEGGFMERYRRRLAEIDAVLAPELKHPG